MASGSKDTSIDGYEELNPSTISPLSLFLLAFLLLESPTFNSFLWFLSLQALYTLHLCGLTRVLCRVPGLCYSFFFWPIKR